MPITHTTYMHTYIESGCRQSISFKDIERCINFGTLSRLFCTSSIAIFTFKLGSNVVIHKDTLGVLCIDSYSYLFCMAEWVSYLNSTPLPTQSITKFMYGPNSQLRTFELKKSGGSVRNDLISDCLELSGVISIRESRKVSRKDESITATTSRLSP